MTKNKNKTDNNIMKKDKNKTKDNRNIDNTKKKEQTKKNTMRAT